MTMTSSMLADRYKQLDAELIAARQRVAELLGEFEQAHTDVVVSKAKYDVAFAKLYNAGEGSIEARKNAATSALEARAIDNAGVKARADILREYLNAARDDVRCIMQQMTNAQSVGAFARAEMTL